MKILSNISLKSYNTMKVDCIAKFFVKIESVDDIIELTKTNVFKENKRLILGGGSNVLIKDEFWDGLVIVNCVKGIEIISSDNGMNLISVGAGENWHDFVMRAVGNNFGGIENMALIPGSVGASPMQNIGAYGMEVKDVIASVEYWDIVSNELKVISNEECKFGYRDSIFKNELKDRAFITRVNFNLCQIDNKYKYKLDYADIQNKMQERGVSIEQINIANLVEMIIEIRNNKLPDRKQIGTAGSFFKNPFVDVRKFQKISEDYNEIKGHEMSNGQIKLSAGQLIDMAGLKGLNKGNVGTYKNHALVIVNNGGSGEEVLDFAEQIQKEVMDKFGVMLEMEVNVY